MLSSGVLRGCRSSGLSQAMRERTCCRSFEPVRWRVIAASAAQTMDVAAMVVTSPR
jgi:hypothetical protein